MTATSMYDQGLGQNQANHAPLTPLTFLERAAYVYPDRLSVVHGARHFIPVRRHPSRKDQHCGTGLPVMVGKRLSDWIGSR